jgi:hypothetical protein
MWLRPLISSKQRNRWLLQAGVDPRLDLLGVNSARWRRILALSEHRGHHPRRWTSWHLLRRKLLKLILLCAISNMIVSSSWPKLSLTRGTLNARKHLGSSCDIAVINLLLQVLFGARFHFLFYLGKRGADLELMCALCDFLASHRRDASS